MVAVPPDHKIQRRENITETVAPRDSRKIKLLLEILMPLGIRHNGVTNLKSAENFLAKQLSGS